MSDHEINRYYELQAKVELLEWKLAEAQRLAKGWEATAFQEAGNTQYYRNLVIKIGEMLGDEAKTADDGSFMDTVLCDKVPELVEKRLLCNADWWKKKHEEAIESWRAEYNDVWAELEKLQEENARLSEDNQALDYDIVRITDEKDALQKLLDGQKAPQGST